MFILIFAASCSNKEKEEPNLPANNVSDNEDKAKDENSNKDDENKESDDWLIEVYKGIYIADGDDIYYIVDGYDKLYSIKKDGSEKTLIHQQERMFRVQIYNDKLYVFSLIYTDSTPSFTIIPGKIVTMNKDGSDVTELDLGIEYTTLYYPASFFIHEDFLFIFVNNFTVPYDGMYNLLDYYKYDLKSGSLTNIVKEIDAGVNEFVHGDTFYYNDYENFDDDSVQSILYKYNIYTDEKSKIEISKFPNSYGTSDLQIKDNYIYYVNGVGICKDNLDGNSDTEVLFELDGENLYIVDLYITDKYIFYIIVDYYENGDSEEAKSKTIVYRMNHDSTDKKEIYSETQRQTNTTPQKVKASRIDDKILVYENRHTNTILFLDLDGNILNRD
jgi:hypothetical protein